MQIINSYSQAGNIKAGQRLRLFHFNRPKLRSWRYTRHGHEYQLDFVDRWILDNVNSTNITAVDFAGWYLEQFGLTTVCLESDDIAKLYWPKCHIEPDIMTWRPTYISTVDPVVFRNPWFLRYATVDQLVAFLETWVQSMTIINFEPNMIQYNYLKFKLFNLVRLRTLFEIEEICNNTWKILPCTNTK
jgi:hypothetical protein